MKLSWMSLVLAASFILLAVYGIQSMPPEEEGPANQMRQSLINNYLVRTRLMDDLFSEVIAGIMASLSDEQKEDPLIVEALATLYAEEGELDEARGLIELAGDAYDDRLFRYAYFDAHYLPEGWTETTTEDWVGARIKATAAKRLGNVEIEQEAQEDLVEYMDKVRLAYNVQVPRHFFSLIGLGLLISMYFSDRQWRRLGKEDFFKLKPLYFPTEDLWRFCALFLSGIVVISLFLSAFSGIPLWLMDVLASLGYIVLGIFLLRRVIFRDHPGEAFSALGLTNLRMHWFNIFQIFGGFSILVACHYYAEMIAILSSWPLDRTDTEALFREILTNPTARIVYGITACIVAPFFEEIFFRGIVFRLLLKSYRPFVAIFSSAILFAVMHPFPLWPLILAKGVGLAVVYYRTANLVIVVWTHALWNLMVLMITFAGTGA
ncbi:MAG: type II CAAX endopeptidase family protein [Acidobacteriota bacterium]|nr:type II CAAX endopeptidase family protein [Acidobacteriota bacterium]